MKMDKFDCFCRVGDRTFRYRASGIIIEDDCLLLASNPRLPYLYSVGGGVHVDETAEQAVIREVFEETGVHYDIDRLAFISERFVNNEHRLSFYFLMKPRGTKTLNAKNDDEKMVWIPLDKLEEYDISPVWYKTELTDISKSIRYFMGK